MICEHFHVVRRNSFFLGDSLRLFEDQYQAAQSAQPYPVAGKFIQLMK